MAVVHLISSHFPPARGGLEAWTKRLAGALARRGFGVVVYICDSSGQYDYAAAARNDGIEIRLIRLNRAVWEEPLIASSASRLLIRAERWRLDALALRNAVQREVAKAPHTLHVLASSYITQEGFLASVVADELELPHAAFVVGTDFSRGIRSPLVAENASHVRMSPPADAESFADGLRGACLALLQGTMRIDHTRVAAWRAHFSESREASQFETVFRELGG